MDKAEACVGLEEAVEFEKYEDCRVVGARRAVDLDRRAVEGTEDGTSLARAPMRQALHGTGDVITLAISTCRG